MLLLGTVSGTLACGGSESGSTTGGGAKKSDPAVEKAPEPE